MACQNKKLVCKFRFCTFYERLKMDLLKQSIKVNDPAKFTEFEALPKVNYSSNDSLYRKGNYWHYPCGSKEDPMPAVMDCDFKCEFSPSIPTDALKYQFYAPYRADKQVCTKFEAFYIGS